LLDELPDVAVIGDITERLKATSDGEKAAAVELALEGLYLARRISKDPDDDGQTVYS
jgi:magnesium chelatase subunit I